MILYIHGFASCGDSTKTRLLKTHFGETEVLSPDVPVEPDTAMAALRRVIEQYDISLLIGSSLGGFYATALSSEFGLDAVLINPSVHPYQTLAPYVGTNTFWCSGEPFEWKSEYLLQLARIAETMRLPDARLLVLLQTGDELLDYKVAEAVYEGYEVVVETGGNHRFENLGAYLERIETFYRDA
ncbi:YqiA/YcfP family alpha/beta fold hydrolase [Sulfurimonas sp. HSL1-2]|uniref:YqiA/YcfP family alpha/beta fold hydrolase n=1 Tax=Thiomicrolovo zhangzhouensis TaxID=3131933 RepID=UPI0031FA4739